MAKLSHVAIAVRDLEEALTLYTDVLGFPSPTLGMMEAKELGVRHAFLPVGDNFVELVQSTDPTNVVGRFVDSHGEGLFAIAVEVDDVDAAIEDLKARGTNAVEAPPVATFPKKRAFIRRQSAKGVLIELLPRNWSSDVVPMK